MELSYQNPLTGVTTQIIARSIHQLFMDTAVAASAPWPGVPNVPGAPVAPPTAGINPPAAAAGPSPMTAVGASPVKAPTSTPAKNHYGGAGQGSQTGTDPTDALREGADRRGYHENFGKETHDNIGRFDAPTHGVVSTDYSLSDSIAMGATVLTECSIGLAVGFLTWGAIRLAMASGDEEQVEHAKAIMKWAIAGMVLGLIALSMVSMVTNAVESA